MATPVAIAQSYVDNNDAATLALAPAFKIMTGRSPEIAADLASQPTLSGFENQVNIKDLHPLSGRFLNHNSHFVVYNDI